MGFTVSIVPLPSGSVFVIGIQIKSIDVPGIYRTKRGKIYEKVEAPSRWVLGRKLPILRIVVKATETMVKAIISLRKVNLTCPRHFNIESHVILQYVSFGLRSPFPGYGMVLTIEKQPEFLGWGIVCPNRAKARYACVI